MSRKSLLKNSFDFNLKNSYTPAYQNQFVLLLKQQLLRKGKGTLARRILFEAFGSIEKTTNRKGFDVLREAIVNVTPVVEVKPQRRGGTVFQVPVEVNPERGVLLALNWLVESARQRGGRGMVSKLAAELIDASNRTGNAVRKKEEAHRMAEANKALSHFRF